MDGSTRAWMIQFSTRRKTNAYSKNATTQFYLHCRFCDRLAVYCRAQQAAVPVNGLFGIRTAESQLTTVASFPLNYFLENLALRADNSALITAMNQKELWYAPPAAATETVTPTLLHTFEQNTWSFNEVEPDVFYLITCNAYTNHESSLHRILIRNS